MYSVNRTANFHAGLLAVIALLALIPGNAHAGNRWDWEEMSKEQETFCDTYMPPFLEIRKTAGDTAALKELDRLYELAEKQFNGTYFLHRVIWYEAQAHSGKNDEEWGLALYEYLFEHDIKNNSMRKCSCKHHDSDYILYGNIIDHCVDLGKAARSREYCLMVEESLFRERKFDLSGASYADIGPVFPFLNEARNRDYPIFEHQMRPDNRNQDKRDFIYYPNIYALNYVAENALLSGDWVRAAELSAWCIRYTDEYMKGDNPMRGEIGRVASYGSRKRLADLALLHGYPDEAARFLREFIVLAEGYYGTGEWDVLLAKLDLAVVRTQTDGLVPEDRALADKADKEITGNWWNSRSVAMMGSLNKARVYHALGHKKEAWEIIDHLMDQAAHDVNPHHWVNMLTTAIDLALADGATRPELEEWLVLALDNARLTGNKFKELPLYEQYAQFLAMKGRFAEAAQIRQEAVRLARAMNLPKRLEENRRALADIMERIEAPRAAQVPAPEAEPLEPADVAGTAEPDGATAQETNAAQTAGGTGVTIASIIDIQPRLSASAALKGQAAYGRFYLHNPSTAPQEGELVLTGPIDQVQWNNEQWLAVGTSPVFENTTLSRKLILDAAATCIVDITGLPTEDGRGSGIECRWIPGERQQAPAAGSWSYKTAETERRTAVIDAHELRNNPFYLVPIHHMIQRLDAGQRQILDFAVAASAPMRIETYDAAGQLLAVDANGDGDFLDKGDFIARDDNRNNWPDLVFEPEQRLTSLIMYVQPGGSMESDTELTVRIRVNGEWQTDAIDVVKPYAPDDR